MKILKLLNKKNLSIIIVSLLLPLSLIAEDKPVDIWNIDKSKLNQNNVNDNDESNEIIKNENSNQILTLDTLKLEPQSPVKEIKFEQNLYSPKIKILGLYDPDDFGLSLNMWSNSGGDEQTLINVTTLDLSAGDYVEVYGKLNVNSGSARLYSAGNYFMGERLIGV